MMAGRSRSDEGVSDLLGHHFVDSEYRAAGRAQGRFSNEPGDIEVSSSMDVRPCIGVPARMDSI
jgi:hypothetical protein